MGTLQDVREDLGVYRLNKMEASAPLTHIMSHPFEKSLPGGGGPPWGSLLHFQRRVKDKASLGNEDFDKMILDMNKAQETMYQELDKFHSAGDQHLLSARDRFQEATGELAEATKLLQTDKEVQHSSITVVLPLAPSLPSCRRCIKRANESDRKRGRLLLF